MRGGIGAFVGVLEAGRCLEGSGVEGEASERSLGGEVAEEALDHPPPGSSLEKTSQPPLGEELGFRVITPASNQYWLQGEQVPVPGLPSVLPTSWLC